MSETPDTWHLADLALALLSVDPAGLGGAVIRLRASPMRDALLDRMETWALTRRRIHPAISDEQLFGSLDFAETLKSQQQIEIKGILDLPCAVVLSMSERCSPALTVKLAQRLDQAQGHCLVALDEGAEAGEQTPTVLSDRLAFHIAPDGRCPVGWTTDFPLAGSVAPRSVLSTASDISTLTAVAATFGIASLRAPQLALRAARAHAALHGRSKLSAEDLQTAAMLVYPSRATHIPQHAEEDPPASPPDSNDLQSNSSDPGETSISDAEILVDAVKAVLPARLLQDLVPAGTGRSATGSGAGQARKGNRRGTPLPSRPGRLKSQARIDLVATLRAAAPWQPIRRKVQPDAPGVLVRPSDIRLKRYQERSDRLLIFAVDASGSAAVTRLSEAKGAVELLLARAYAARDHVALISFRGKGAEVLLPPTRSLVQTKRRLASLPGGGGTPLAAGLQQAAHLAACGRAKGLTPTVIILTDGRANVALDGAPDRNKASEDADRLARLVRAEGTRALVIDMGQRPQPTLKALAALMDAPYLALPRADAHRLSGAVHTALEAP